MVLKLVWKRNNHGGYNGYCGELRVFTINLNIFRHEDPNEDYVLRSALPYYENLRVNGTKNDLMDKSSELLKEWLNKLGLSHIQGDTYSA